MKVEIINPEVVKDLYHNHGVFACTCYDTPEKYADKVGENCEKSGHMSGSRCEYIKFRITDVDRGTAEQCLRHEIGAQVPVEHQDNYFFSDYMEQVVDISPDHIVKNMASFRYIDKDGFKWETPATISNYPDIKNRYDHLMETINYERSIIKAMLEAKGVSSHRANQDVNFVLPRATTTSFVIGFTPEALIHFCHKRLCTRSQEFIREMAKQMKKEVNVLNPSFASELVPHCKHLLWCPEGNHCCGAMKTRAELMDQLNEENKV